MTVLQDFKEPLKINQIQGNKKIATELYCVVQRVAIFEVDAVADNF
ncbi:MAG: hypothetical protein WC806_04170 [Candidatus Gracilibacteria bacterium]|jgi:hypothetical protein